MGSNFPLARLILGTSLSSCLIHQAQAHKKSLTPKRIYRHTGYKTEGQPKQHQHCHRMSVHASGTHSREATFRRHQAGHPGEPAADPSVQSQHPQTLGQSPSLSPGDHRGLRQTPTNTELLLFNRSPGSPPPALISLHLREISYFLFCCSLSRMLTGQTLVST